MDCRTVLAQQVQRKEGDSILRDPVVVAVHRGGDLSRDDHEKLMQWAISCFERVLVHYGEELDETIRPAIVVAEGRCEGSYTTEKQSALPGLFTLM